MNIYTLEIYTLYGISLRPSLTPTHKYTHADVLKVDVCRHDLGKDYAMTVNKSLQAVLLDLFPGYNGATHTNWDH